MTPAQRLRIGSRGSDLALAQARYVNERLKALPNAPETQIVIIKTRGDQIQNIPLYELDTGSPDERKGLFTKEIEEALLANEIDIAVHSFKDMPTVNSPGLTIASMPQRLNPLDVLVFRRDKRVSEEPPFIAPGSVIGTSSVRRIEAVNHRWPQCRTVPLRGNVPTRIKKLAAGEVDAILLSGAGVERLTGQGFFDSFEVPMQDYEFISLPPHLFPPAPAQGALAIQCREKDPRTISMIHRIEESTAYTAVRAERHILAGLQGGCHLPLGAHCTHADGRYAMHIFLGKEAEDNRKGRPYSYTRYGTDSDWLAGEVLNEILHPQTVVLTGRNERTAELHKKFGDAVRMLVLIETSPVDPGEEERSTFFRWFSEVESGRELLIAAFSVPGVHSLRSFLDRNGKSLPFARWAVTGELTRESVRHVFPGHEITFVSPDGTGRSLAELLIQNRSALPERILAVSAVEHRDEFFVITGEAGISLAHLRLYNLEKRVPERGELDALPNGSRIVFASPSAANAFFDAFDGYTKRSPEKRDAFRFCVIGPTTEKAVLNRGYPVYTVSPLPDLERFTEDLL